ncbi:MAG: SBBP repeat-containing protein [bacterium]
MKKLFSLVLALTLFSAVSCGESDKTKSGVGEECKKASDCKKGLKCIDFVCVEPADLNDDFANSDDDNGNLEKENDDFEVDDGDSVNDDDESSKKGTLGDECGKTDDCADGLRCVDFKCVEGLENQDGTCKEGYESDGARCVDINECERGTDNCHQFAKCVNTSGSFECLCKENYTGNGVECTPDTLENQACTGLPESGAWNTVDKITQTWDGSKWAPSTEGTFNIEPSDTECRFKCTKNSIPWDNLTCSSIFRQWGTAGNEITKSIAVDSIGNVYIAGETDSYFGNFTNIGGRDLFLTKFNNLGVLQWTKQWGTNQDDYIEGIAIDKDDNLFAIGFTDGVFIGEKSPGGKDIFLTKWNSSGTREWTKQWGTDKDDKGTALAFDSKGNFYITGHTLGSFPNFPNSGATDIFLTIIKSDLSNMWTQQWGTNGYELVSAIVFDKDDFIYVTGSTTGRFQDKTNKGSEDVFVTKLNSSGARQWTQQWGTKGLDRAVSIAVDGSGNIVLAGSTDGVFEENSSKGDLDIFFSKLDGSGEILWTKQDGTNGEDTVNAMDVDSFGNIFVVGHTKGSFESFNNSGGTDIFIVKYSSDAEKKWVQQWGTDKSDIGVSVALDSSGNIFVSGYTAGSLGDYTNESSSDALLIKWVE